MTKSSTVAAGIPPLYVRDFITINKAAIRVKHANSMQGKVYKTQLLKPGTGTAAYSLDEGDHNVKPDGYDHVALYSGPAGESASSTIEYD